MLKWKKERKIEQIFLDFHHRLLRKLRFEKFSWITRASFTLFFLGSRFFNVFSPFYPGFSMFSKYIKSYIWTLSREKTWVKNFSYYHVLLIINVNEKSLHVASHCKNCYVFFGKITDDVIQASQKVWYKLCPVFFVFFLVLVNQICFDIAVSKKNVIY